MKSMRRAALLLLVLIAATTCRTWRTTSVEPDPVGVLGERRPPGVTSQPCREVGRIRCASDECKGMNMDYVTLSCAGGKEVNQCVASLGCSTE